jgi:hypothetical protein
LAAFFNKMDEYLEEVAEYRSNGSLSSSGTPASNPRKLTKEDRDRRLREFLQSREVFIKIQLLTDSRI